MNSIKKCSRVINSNKNKLSSEIILIFNFHPNAHLVCLFYKHMNVQMI